MSTIMRRECTCAICGVTHEYRYVASTNTFGGEPDLDSRPPEMLRSTMGLWVHGCDCGYISREVSDKSSVSREWLQSENYLMSEGLHFKSIIADSFYKGYLIKTYDNDIEDAFYMMLYAAWACDDINDVENAIICRKKAVGISSELLQSRYENCEELLLMRADLMRRSKMFEDLIKEYASVKVKQPLHKQILKFEIKKAKEHDASRYTVGSLNSPKDRERRQSNSELEEIRLDDEWLELLKKQEDQR